MSISLGFGYLFESYILNNLGLLCCHADHFSECVENHAFETYDKFIKAEGGELVSYAFEVLAVTLSLL